MTRTRVLFLVGTLIRLSTVGLALSARSLSADPAQVVGVELVLQVNADPAQVVGVEQVGQPISLSRVTYPRLLV